MAEQRRNISRNPPSLLEMFRANWWMVTFLSIVALFAWQSSHKKQLITNDLQQRFATVLQEKRLAALERDDLLLQIQGQDDPEWVELVLMRRLGLVPEGQVKVYFEKSSQ